MKSIPAQTVQDVLLECRTHQIAAAWHNKLFVEVKEFKELWQHCVLSLVGDHRACDAALSSRVRYQVPFLRNCRRFFPHRATSNTNARTIPIVLAMPILSPRQLRYVVK
jgi:hypothetical protein